MSLATSTLSTILTPSPSASSCPLSQIYTLPTTDAACAIPNKPSSNYTAAMATCCHAAPVTPYASACGLYCLAIDQSVGDLATCLTSNGVSFGDAFCNKNTTATATARLSTSSASRTATGTARSSGSGSVTGTAKASAASKGAAAGGYAQGWGVSKASAAVMGLLVLSSAVGAVL